MVKKGSKKSKNKKKRESEELKEEISEVDKEYFQILINDLQNQVTKLTDKCHELETNNEELINSLKQLDEDRADIIAYLRRELSDRTAESNELYDRLTGLKKARNDEAEAYENRITTMHKEATVAYELLSAEVKLLQGKLNALEEFRAQRDDLNAKFERQEEQIKENEKLHQSAIHDIEQNFVISKDRLKKEMEQQLIKLSTEFQSATTIRIAATTQRAIRENVALTSEVSKIRKESLIKREKIIQYEQQISDLKRELLLVKNIIRINSQRKCNIKMENTSTQTIVSSLSTTDADAVNYKEEKEIKFKEQSPQPSSSSRISDTDSSSQSGPLYLPGSLGLIN